jgi:hypothetical protein
VGPSTKPLTRPQRRRGDLPVGGDHLQVAVTDRVIASSPCVGISLRERIDTEIVPFHVSEVTAPAGAVPDRYRALIVFSAPGWACARASASDSASTGSTSSAAGPRRPPTLQGPRRWFSSSDRPRQAPGSARPHVRHRRVGYSRPARPLPPCPAGLVFTNTPANRYARARPARCGTMRRRRLLYPSGSLFTTSDTSTRRF